ncbi:MAG: hypothetical protein Q8J85_02500 [Sulfuricurvum sp.]|nr:hypothetical protein [Sulfuricurvum sp.]
MIKIGLAIILAAMSLYASTPNVEQKANLQETVEIQKRLYERYERTKRPVEKAHALKVYKDFTANAKEAYGESIKSI